MCPDDLLQVCQALTSLPGRASATLRCLKLGPALHEPTPGPEGTLQGNLAGDAADDNDLWAAQWRDAALQGLVGVVQAMRDLQALEIWGLAAAEKEVLSQVCQSLLDEARPGPRVANTH